MLTSTQQFLMRPCACVQSKFFEGRGGDTLCTPSPLRTTFVFTYPLSQDLFEKFLIDPPPPHFKPLSLPPPPPPPPPHTHTHTHTPHKNFDHTTTIKDIAYIVWGTMERTSHFNGCSFDGYTWQALQKGDGNGATSAGMAVPLSQKKLNKDLLSSNVISIFLHFHSYILLRESKNHEKSIN